MCLHNYARGTTLRLAWLLVLCYMYTSCFTLQSTRIYELCFVECALGVLKCRRATLTMCLLKNENGITMTALKTLKH